VSSELHTARASLGGAVRRMVGWRESGTPLRRLEPATTATPVILMLGPRISIDGEPVGSFAAGPYLRPVVTEHDGEQEGIQIDLEPLAARQLLGVPMAELAERCVSLDELIGRELTEWVGDADAWADRFDRVEFALRRRLAESEPARPEVAWAVGRLRATAGRMRVDELARELGWSRRHLAAQFRDAVGHSPKAMARVIRFEHALARLRAGEALADVAYSAGYADQAHLNRDFRAFTGLTPTDYLRRIEDPEVLGVPAGQVTFVQDGMRAAA
jgi:AraC-like DNA-binding protein